MDFTSFKNTIPLLKENTVLGAEAQYKLAPKLRKPFSSEFIENTNPKKAAVLALFYPDKNNNTTFLLTKRAAYKGVHSAQISFPGGKYDIEDGSLKNTALRETHEEVGVSKNKISVFKEMTNVFIPPSNFIVTPFLAYSTEKPNFSINNEVEHVLEIELSDFLKDSSISKTVISTSYAKEMEVPCFKLNNQIVWGATAMMLSEIRTLLKSV